MKKEYIFAGFGGQGMLLIGKFLANIQFFHQHLL